MEHCENGSIQKKGKLLKLQFAGFQKLLQREIAEFGKLQNTFECNLRQLHVKWGCAFGIYLFYHFTLLTEWLERDCFSFSRNCSSFFILNLSKFTCCKTRQVSTLSVCWHLPRKRNCHQIYRQISRKFL